MPEPAVQRKACSPESGELVPTITDPSALTAVALLELPPGRYPSPTMPEPAVQRKAWLLAMVPTTTEPSALTPLAELARPPTPTMPEPAVQRKARHIVAAPGVG